MTFNSEGVAIEAGRLMLKRIEELLNAGESFSIETTLATSKQLLKEYALHNDSLVVGDDKGYVMDVPAKKI